MQRRQLEEVLSWRLITELWRRFPGGYCLIETHPGGGQYDCLSLIELDGRRTSILDVNRGGGSVHMHHGRSPQSWPEWVERMLTDPRRLLYEVTDAMGTETPANLPNSTPATVSFRFICELLTHAVGRLESWECRNGYCDISGYEGGKRTEWFTAFPAAHVNRNKKSVAGQRQTDSSVLRTTYRAFLYHGVRDLVSSLRNPQLHRPTMRWFGRSGAYASKRLAREIISKGHGRRRD